MPVVAWHNRMNIASGTHLTDDLNKHTVHVCAKIFICKNIHL